MTQELSFKAASGTVGIDEMQGIVECFVAAVGNKDSVGDIIIPGAFNDSLKRRTPRVVWGHDWNHPIGKVLEIYEVPSTDRRLPEKMRKAGVGGVYARVQFNLKSERGREAFNSVVFFGEDQEWCVDEETEILTDRGWLRYDELTTEDRAYVLDPELGWGKFEQVEAVNVFPAKKRMMRLIETGGFSSLTTAAHRWPVANNTDGGKVRWTTTADLDYRDRIIRAAGTADAPDSQKYSDSFVELVGWFWTEGWIPPADHPDAGLYIAQSVKHNPQHAASIRHALQATFPGEWSERHSPDDMARFRLKRSAAAHILDVTGDDKEPTAHFLMSLTRSQLRLLIETCMAGDGHNSKSGQQTWYQVSERGVRAFEMLCALAGQPTNTSPQKDYGNRYGRPPQSVSLLRNGVATPLAAIRVKQAGKKGAPRTPAIDKLVEKDGIVWCPTTPSGTWLARRNGSVYFTGNSIGYKTLDSIYDQSRQANLLKELELYEVSPVLHGANQLTATISVKSDAAEKEVDSFQKSKWQKFDPEFAEMIRTDHPEIWRLGGNIKGNDQYRALKPISDRGGKAESQAEINALELREAWVARHHEDFRPAGVMAQIKWLAVGSRGEAYMKRVIREEIAKRNPQEKTDSSPSTSPVTNVDKAKDEVDAALTERFGGISRIVEITDEEVIFEHAPNTDVAINGKWGRFKASFSRDDDGNVKIGPAIEAKREEKKPESTDTSTQASEEKGLSPEEVKAPSASDITAITDAVGLDPLPQERITGDVLRGYGPRRGNLERLLRYWRPIMRKPGGFRRCRVILANHPELYPLENICAWLHHETTGLWPNEGCHHPTMKNCRRKLRNVTRGSIWSDSEFDNRLRSRFKDASASIMDYAPAEREYIAAMMSIVSKYGRLADGDENGIYVGYTGPSENEVAHMGIKCENCAFYKGDGLCKIVETPVHPGGKCRLAAIDYDSVNDADDEDEDFLLAQFDAALRNFIKEEPQFLAYLMDEKNWDHVGDDEDGAEKPHPMMYEMEDGDDEEDMPAPRMIRRWGQQEQKPGCGCGCSGSKSAQEEKVGRVLSSRNLQKVQQALTLLQEVVESAGQDIEMKPLSVPALANEIKSAIEPVAEFYGFDVKVSDYKVEIANFDDLAEEAKSAIDNALGHATGDNAYIVIETEPERMMALKSLIDEIAGDADIIIDEMEGSWLAVQARTKSFVDHVTNHISDSPIQIKGFGIGELTEGCGCDE